MPKKQIKGKRIGFKIITLAQEGEHQKFLAWIKNNPSPMNVWVKEL